MAALPQGRYWVVFRDKPIADFNPYDYFSQKTIDRRARSGIPLVMISDLPVSETYCSEIEKYSDILTKSRWLNAVSVDLDAATLAKVTALPFVFEVRQVHSGMKAAGDEDIKRITDRKTLEHITNQVNALGGNLFAAAGIDGKGVRIAVFDGGFPGVDTLEIFRHLREENRIIATWDFVKNREFVYDYSSHGTSVLSCIAGIYDSLAFGLGTGAEFLLARTEVTREVFSEEENWAMAMEWADKNGADIINSSLGYTYHRYFPREMDGKATFVSRIATLAARKGILVVNAAGNDGDKRWKVIGAPADADSIISVGGVSSETGIHSGFSSFGPTFDGRMKPNVSAFSDVIAASTRKTSRLTFGTSFASPLVAGFAACVMQMHPEWDNISVLKEIERSGHLYPYFDYAHGYGVPQASYFLGCREIVPPSFRFDTEDGKLCIRLMPEVVKTLADSAECPAPERMARVRGLSGISPEVSGLHRYSLDDDYLYFHIESPEGGKIRKYRVIEVNESEQYTIESDLLLPGESVFVFFRGYSLVYSADALEEAGLVQTIQN
jgi:hypothetical protein